jgi:ABC-2 type transport system permease protein
MESLTTALPEHVIERTTLQRYFTGIWVIWLREFKRFWRDTPRRIGAFVQPLVYLFLLGTGMQSAFKTFGAGAATKYVIFVFPGIVGMTVLFTSVFSAISILWDREFGFLKEVLVSPVPRTSVALGKIVGGATTAVLQGLIFMLLMFVPSFFGFSFSTLGKMLLLIPVVILLSIGMTAMGVAIAARMKSFEGFPIVMNFILLPLFLLSGAFFPLQGLPGWMNFLTKINPLTYGVDALRGIALKGVQVTSGASSAISKIPKSVLAQIPPQVKTIIGQSMAQAPKLQVQRYPLWLDIAVVIGFTLVMMVVAIWQFNRQE